MNNSLPGRRNSLYHRLLLGLVALLWWGMNQFTHNNDQSQTS
jgi:hypothetical protein